jgi:hypothetical protein
MRRLYEWIRILIKEKINIFYKGFCSGSILSWIFLFGSGFNSEVFLLYAYLIKVFAVVVSGVLSGFATLLGSDFYKWVKSKIANKKSAIKSKRKNKAA